MVDGMASAPQVLLLCRVKEASDDRQHSQHPPRGLTLTACRLKRHEGSGNRLVGVNCGTRERMKGSV